MRRYLDEVGVKRKDRPEGWHNNLKRKIKCWFQRRRYGFDYRETFDLDYTWTLWMYERLKMFRKYATEMVDLTEQRYEFDGEKWSLLELIDMMLTRLEYRLNPKFKYDDCAPDDEREFNYVHTAERIWAVICRDMWW